MRIILLFIGFTIFSLSGITQTRIDDTFSFDTDPAKKYSLYIPSSYVVSAANKVMLAFHPLNTARWDAKSWCDTLIDFAEANDLILICPDGGVDGAVDDAIDTAFTTVLIDSVANWYNVNFDKFYGMGFSWGARTLYTYGLSHGNLIKGYIPVGAAITGTVQVNETLQMNGGGKPFYIVHGTADSPASRFYPIRDSLISKGAIVETNLMTGVGHTIDFPNRNEILTEAFNWIDSVNCNISLGLNKIPGDVNFIGVYPNPATETINIDLEDEIEKASIYDLSGNLLLKGATTKFTVSELKNGVYILLVTTNKGQYRTHFVKR